MRRFIFVLPPVCGVVLALGCTPQAIPPGDDSVLGMVLASVGAPDGQGVSEQTHAPAAYGPTRIDGAVTGRDGFQLFDLGAAATGQQWLVANAGAGFFERFTVVLLDEHHDLLRRDVLSGTVELQHVMRHDTQRIYLGVTPTTGSAGGAFSFDIRRADGFAVPSPRRQVVWLNFTGGRDVRIHRRGGTSFAAFDAAVLGDPYAGRTAEVKRSIVAAMRADYAGFDVELISSDDGGPPAGEYSVVHFGGHDSGLLGLADNVDRYNEEQRQNAIVYVNTFANYINMELTPDEMGQMIGNVGSHELGHLLGLYHTRDPSDVMDSTGTAWELAEDQRFGRMPLEESVFPTGMENSRLMLEQTVGGDPNFVAHETVADKAESRSKTLLRAFAQDELRATCGTCLLLDE